MNIILHEISGISVGLDKKDGYLNATALAAAHYSKTSIRRDVAHWLTNKRTKESISHLSIVTGIPVTELYQVFQGVQHEKQGTWLHPKLAVRFAIWLSDEIGFEIENFIADWRSNKSANTFPEKLVGQVDKHPELVAAEMVTGTIDLIMGHANINPNIIAGVKCSAIAEMYPQYRVAMEVVKKNLLLPVASNLLSPTDLAKIWEERTGEKLSAIAFNKKLEAANLQKKTGKKELAWCAIGCGIDHSEVVLDTAAGHAKTVQRLMWHESVLDLLTTT